MAAPGPEWMLWAKKLRDEHVNLVESLETLSSTVAKAPLPVQITDLEASQLALQQEVNSLRETLAAAELQREQHSRIADERIAALEQQVRTAARLRDQNAKDNNEQIKRLEEDVAALRRRAPSASKLRVTSAGTRHTSQLNAENLANVSDASSKRSSMQIYFETSAQRKRNWSGQAQQWPSSVQNIDSDETRDRSEDLEALQSVSPCNTPESLRSATPGGPEASPSATPSDMSSLVSVISFPHSSIHTAEASARDSSPPAVALESQGGLDLFEYLIQCEDEITSRLPAYERRLVEAFVAGLSDKVHKSTLKSRLDEQAWNWKIAFEGANQIAEEALAQGRRGKSKPSPSRDSNGRFKKKSRRSYEG